MSCALILDDAASQPHEALFAATATHQTLRKMQLREVATQRVMWSCRPGAVALRRRSRSAAARRRPGRCKCATHSPCGGSTQERPARPRGDRRLGVDGRAAGRNPSSFTRRARGPLDASNLRGSAGQVDEAPVALDAILAQAQPCGGSAHSRSRQRTSGACDGGATSQVRSP